MSKFLPEPLPERICDYSFSEPHKIQAMLSVGVRVLREDFLGMEIKPTPHITVALGKTDDPLENTYDLSLRMARNLANRIIEMCNAVEAKE